MGGVDGPPSLPDRPDPPPRASPPRGIRRSVHGLAGTTRAAHESLGRWANTGPGSVVVSRKARPRHLSVAREVMQETMTEGPA